VCGAGERWARACSSAEATVVVVAGGEAFGLVRHLEEPLPRAAAAGVLEQQLPALLPCVAAAVARGSGCGAKPRQRRRAGTFHTLENADILAAAFSLTPSLLWLRLPRLLAVATCVRARPERVGVWREFV
jgi:hypothetical protein